MTKPTDEAAKLARDILADINKVRYTELERPGAPEVQNGLREIIAKRIAKHLAAKDAEIERLREALASIVRAFEKCPYDFDSCQSVPRIAKEALQQEPTNETN